MVFTLALCVPLAAVENAQAQGGRGGRGGKSGGGKQQHKAPTVDRSNKPAAYVNEPGSHKGQIAKFEPTTSEKDEDLIGLLTVRPSEKGAKTLKLQVRKDGRLKLEVGGKPFDVEACGELFWKGLYCTVNWAYADSELGKAKPSLKELRSITFDSLTVQGKIEEIQGDSVTVRGRPKDNREWPDATSKEGGGGTQRSGKANTAASDKTKQVLPKKLKLKIFENVTSFLDAKRQPLEMGEFGVEQPIEALVVYGKQQGILVELQSLTAEESKKEEPQVGRKPGTGEGGGNTGGPRGRGGRGGPRRAGG
jgi:hypothetical protein